MSYSDSNSDQPSPATRLYNPYQDLHLPSQTLYHLPTSPEFLFTEESLRQRRSWGENLTFYTGSAYLTASLAGGGSGFFSALRSFEPTDTLKLKVNRILNSSGHSGRIWGNRVGIAGLIYAMMESGIVAVTDRDDVWSSVAAGLGTGAVCRAARGVRSAKEMAFEGSKAAAIFVLLNVIFFTCVSSHNVPACPPKAPPAPKKPAKCPKDTLKFGVCGNWLGLVHEALGTPPSEECCTLIKGLADLEAALCLCTAIKANVLGVVKLKVPVAVSLLLSACGKKVPEGFKCA